MPYDQNARQSSDSFVPYQLFYKLIGLDFVFSSFLLKHPTTLFMFSTNGITLNLRRV